MSSEIVSARTRYEACPLCNSTSLVAAKSADCSHHPLYNPVIPPTMNWLRCSGCDHVFVEGYFTPEALRHLFGKTHENQKVGYQVEAQRHVSSRMIEKVLPYCQSGSWLDIGFGNGSLILTAQEYGFTPIGVDLREDNVDEIRKLGIEAFRTEIAELVLSQPVDVVSMADVLEHMPYPRESLRLVHNFLKRDGILFLSMPNSDNPAWKILDRSDVNPYWGEIEHYHNFGRTRLFQLLNETGFEPLRYGISERYRVCMEVIARRR